jgi:large subunit ribosomal protein L25
MLKVFLRDKNKKSESYRKEGKLPGVIYGPNINSTPIYTEIKEFISFLKEHEGNLIDINFENKNYKAILREIQYHPINNKPIHFDIYVPSLEEKIEIKVPLEFIGISPALSKGYLLSFNLKELDIETKPQYIPEKIEVDISNLEELGQSIYVKDIKFDENIKVLMDPNFPIVTVIASQSEEIVS